MARRGSGDDRAGRHPRHAAQARAPRRRRPDPRPHQGPGAGVRLRSRGAVVVGALPRRPAGSRWHGRGRRRRTAGMRGRRRARADRPAGAPRVHAAQGDLDRQCHAIIGARSRRWCLLGDPFGERLGVIWSSARRRSSAQRSDGGSGVDVQCGRSTSTTRRRPPPGRRWRRRHRGQRWRAALDRDSGR